DELERDLAATALARVAPEHPALGPLRKGKIPAKPPKPAHTITIIHGTWASGNAWYQPNGDFFNYIGTLRPDLYSNGDFFRWTGGYSDAARTDGGKRLVEWVAAHNEAGLDLIAHSHGASVCMLATGCAYFTTTHNQSQIYDLRPVGLLGSETKHGDMKISWGFAQVEERLEGSLASFARA
ncbi:MAG: hypothetical protein HY235_01080, partial [Acidobacteria bacterium]|nr:hypothetical protein [Acidobacteriota bacterium]